jgi:hypothetical protein
MKFVGIKLPFSQPISLEQPSQIKRYAPDLDFRLIFRFPRSLPAGSLGISATKGETEDASHPQD